MSRRRTLQSVGPSEPGPPSSTLELIAVGQPTWQTVEALLDLLASSRAVFPTATSDFNWISGFERGRHLTFENGARSTRLQIEYVKECWETFEKLGRIQRSDVLEPGRCSAFMMGLFAQVPGVEEGKGDCLVLAGAPRVSRARRTRVPAGSV